MRSTDQADINIRGLTGHSCYLTRFGSPVYHLLQETEMRPSVPSTSNLKLFSFIRELHDSVLERRCAYERQSLQLAVWLEERDSTSQYNGHNCDDVS